MQRAGQNARKSEYRKKKLGAVKGKTKISTIHYEKLMSTIPGGLNS